MNYLLISLFACFATVELLAIGMEDDPLLTMVKFDQLEVSLTEDTSLAVRDAEVWIGRDLEKLWIKAEVETSSSQVENLELQWLYSKAVTAFWELQFGVKTDFEPRPERHWGVIAAKGLAPYLFEVDAALFVSKAGRMAVRLEAEYDYMLTQKLILSPEIEVNAFSRDDSATNTGKGLSTIEAGLRMRYEIKRELAPYIGIHWERKYGTTADFIAAAGDSIEDLHVVAGLRFWF